MRKLLILDCTPLAKGGGVQVAIDLLRLLARQSGVSFEWRATIPTSIRHYIPDEFIRDSRTIWIEKAGFFSILRIRQTLASLESALNPTAVYTVFGPAYHNFRCPHAVGFALPKLIYNRREWTLNGTAWRDAVPGWIKRSLQLRSLRRADILVVETETVRLRLQRAIPGNCPEVIIIPNSVNTAHQAHASARIRSDSSASARIFVPSAWYEHKNLAVLPAVARALQQHIAGLDFRLVLTLRESSCHAHGLLRSATTVHSAEHFEFIGELTVEEIAREYRRSDCVFLPTLLECSTAVYPESFFHMRPLVTSDRDFARELCADAALYVDPHDPVSMAAAIAAVILDKRLAGSLVAAGSKQLQRQYPSGRQKQELQLTLIDRLLRQS